MSIMHGSFQCMYVLYTIFFFSNDTATTEIYTLSLHDALPISLAANRVTDHSAGAVDNAAGVVAVLTTVDALPREAGVGVLFPDAEEYGLLGARALVRERANLLGDTCIVNFDGVDDRGSTIAFIHRSGPAVERVAAALGARRARWLPVLVDGLALSGAAREGVTIMRGDWRTG